jgi:hypothetical protein
VRAARDEPRRLASLGVDAQPYNLVMFTISAAITALAGALYVNLGQYVSPELGNWFVSGNFLIMVIFGGIGSLSGPVFGAAALIALEEVLAGATERWPFLLGIAGVFCSGTIETNGEVSARSVVVGKHAEQGFGALIVMNCVDLDAGGRCTPSSTEWCGQTLLAQIAGIRPESGKIFFDGVDIWFSRTSGHANR